MRHTGATAVIACEGLGKSFDGVAVVRGVDLQIAAGSIVGFIGPSGCGKTTTVRLLTGLFEPTTGWATINGTTAARLTDRERQRIGYLPQIPALFPELSLWENLSFHASMYGLRFLVATVGLVDSPPPQVVADTDPVPVTVTATRDNWLAQIELVPATTGGTTMHVYLLATDGSRDVADEITVTAALPAQDLGPIDIPTIPAAPNHVSTNDADFPIPGTWELTVTARFGEFDQVVLTTTAEIR